MTDPFEEASLFSQYALTVISAQNWKQNVNIKSMQKTLPNARFYRTGEQNFLQNKSKQWKQKNEHAENDTLVLR